MDSREIAAEFKKYMPGFIIGSIMDGGDDLIVYLTKPGLKSGEYMMDQEYKYNKKTHKITPFRVTDNPELYRRAERHILYTRPGLGGA